jgi:hypothetical protein
MAKLKIKEGSLTVTMDEDPSNQLTDGAFPGGGVVWVEFLDFGTRYKFRRGIIISAKVDGAEESEDFAI